MDSLVNATDLSWTSQSLSSNQSVQSHLKQRNRNQRELFRFLYDTFITPENAMHFIYIPTMLKQQLNSLFSNYSQTLLTEKSVERTALLEKIEGKFKNVFLFVILIAEQSVLLDSLFIGILKLVSDTWFLSFKTGQKLVIFDKFVNYKLPTANASYKKVDRLKARGLNDDKTAGRMGSLYDFLELERNGTVHGNESTGLDSKTVISKDKRKKNQAILMSKMNFVDVLQTDDLYEAFRKHSDVSI